MQFYFKEHKDDPLVTKTVGYHAFIIRNGVADVPDMPDIDPALSGKAKDRVTRQRQAAVEAWHEAARELGGVPYEPQAAVEAEIEVAAKSEKSSKGVRNNER